MKTKKTIGIIGLGRFGTLTATVLSDFFKVKVYHYRKRESDEKIARKTGAELASFEQVIDCDYLILAIPISKTEELIKKIAKIIKPKTTVLDTCSVKELPCQWLKKHLPKEIDILGTHPMFGPVTTKFNLDKKSFELEDKQIILCPVRISKEKLLKTEKFLKELKLKVLTVSPKEHDKQNAKTLSLVHFLGRSLTKAGIGKQEIFTPGYTDLLSILPHTNNDDWQLFYDMNNFNLHSKEIRSKFLCACDSIEQKIIKADSEDKFDFNRKMIDKIDRKIFTLLEERMECVKEIGKYKKSQGIKTVDKKRESEIINARMKQTNLNPSFIKKIYKAIFNESYQIQK